MFKSYLWVEASHSPTLGSVASSPWQSWQDAISGVSSISTRSTPFVFGARNSSIRVGGVVAPWLELIMYVNPVYPITKIFWTHTCICRSKTLPKAQQTRGLSSFFKINFLKSYQELLHKSCSSFIFKILTKNNNSERPIDALAVKNINY